MKVICSKCNETYEAKLSELTDDGLCTKCASSSPSQENIPQSCNECDNDNISNSQPKNTEDTSTDDLVQQDNDKKSYGGIGRTGFICGYIAVQFAKLCLFLGVRFFSGILGDVVKDEDMIILGLLISLFLIICHLTSDRLVNIGKNKWELLLLLVPFANIYVIISCLSCQEGYQDTKKLDTNGKIIGGILFVLIVLKILGIVVASF